MALSFGATSENLFRGIDRMIASLATALPRRNSQRRPSFSRAWQLERGTDVFTASVTVSGGFPGSLRCQHLLFGTSLHLTDSWMIVGEGTGTGFALPLNRISGNSVQHCGGLKPPYLTVWYQDGDFTGTFSFTFHGTSRNLAGVFRANGMQARLAELGVPVVDDDFAQFNPPIHYVWEDVGEIVDDESLFRGYARASVGGWFGAELDTAEVWITERSLIWCPAHGVGLNCLALEEIIHCRNGFGDRLAIGIVDGYDARYDLFFDFGRPGDHSHPATHVQHLLAAAGVPVSSASLAMAPWRSGGTRRPSEI